MYWEEIIIVGKNQIQTFLGCWVQTPDVPGETYPEYITVFLFGFGSSDKSIIITGWWEKISHTLPIGKRLVSLTHEIPAQIMNSLILWVLIWLVNGVYGTDLRKFFNSTYRDSSVDWKTVILNSHSYLIPFKIMLLFSIYLC